MGTCKVGAQGNLSCGTVYDATTESLSSSSLKKFALNLVKAPTYKGEISGTESVMIESVTNAGMYICAYKLSWSLGACYQDYGTGAYWIPDKPFAMELLPYSGPLCSSDCGAYGSGSGGGQTLLDEVLAFVLGWIAFAFGLWVWCRWCCTVGPKEAIKGTVQQIIQEMWPEEAASRSLDFAIHTEGYRKIPLLEKAIKQGEDAIAKGSKGSLGSDLADKVEEAKQILLEEEAKKAVREEEAK